MKLLFLIWVRIQACVYVCVLYLFLVWIKTIPLTRGYRKKKRESDIILTFVFSPEENQSYSVLVIVSLQMSWKLEYFNASLLESLFLSRIPFKDEIPKCTVPWPSRVISLDTPQARTRLSASCPVAQWFSDALMVSDTGSSETPVDWLGIFYIASIHKDFFSCVIKWRSAKPLRFLKF